MSVVVGEDSIAKLLYFEICLLLAPIPGMLGLALRKILWPRLFGSCGKGTVFGSGIKLMHPGKIHIGKRTIISDNCILDGRHSNSNNAISLGNDVMLAYGVMLSCKDGSITLENNVGMGAYTIVQSTKGNPVTIGADSILGPRCYITGGGNYNIDRTDIPISKQGMKVMGGTNLSNGVWLGASVTVLGGTSIGNDSIIGAGAIVTKSLPSLSINVGVPARVITKRKTTKPEDAL
jgi:acetyltransferase-like isoleucine patch superfamily enzyme